MPDAAADAGITPADPLDAFVTATAGVIASLGAIADERTRLLEKREQQNAQLIERTDQVNDREERGASGQIAKDAAELLPAEIDRRLAYHTAVLNRAVLIGAPIAAMFVLLLGIGGGYLAGYRHGGADAISNVTDLRAALAESVPGATTWRNLIEWNGPGVEDSMKQCQPAQPVDGRTACFVPLWSSPAVPTGKVKAVAR